MERLYDGQIAEIVYKGEHNHSRPKTNPSGGGTQDSNTNLWSNQNGERNEGKFKAPMVDVGGEARPENPSGVSGECEEARSKGFEAEEDQSRRKKR